MTAKAMTAAEANKEIVTRGSFETYVDGNMEIVDELVSDDYVLHDPLEPEEIRGRDGLKEYIDELRTVFPDLSADIEYMIAEDDFVAVRFTTSGTYERTNPDFGVDADGQTFEVSGMEFDRIEDGKLVETWLEYDALGFMRQLGVMVDAEAAR